MKKITLFFIIFLYLSAACSRRHEISSALVNNYNDQIKQAEDSSESWVNSPILIALKLTYASQCSRETNISYKMLNKGENPRMVLIKIEEFGVLDDSKDENYYIFYFKKDTANHWRLVPTLESLK